MFTNKYGRHDPELVRIAKHFAAELINNGIYADDDANDLQQELIIAGMQALCRFDRLKSQRTTFLYAILHRKAIDLAKYIQREKRAREMESFSLDDFCPENLEEELLWEEVIGAAHTFTEDRTVRAERKDMHALRIDLAEALMELPPVLRGLCRLHSHLRHEEARREAGMAKSTHHRAMRQIREFLAERGFTPSGTNRTTASDH